ncbi:hypothetical protein [Mycobacterium sp.]|uniref:hypothetical protein n=1 Tax=Mycobacterium sp. TaxID=1785 RepID=UPI003F9EAA0C
MTDYVSSDLLSRKEFLEEYGFSDSAERRGRRQGEAWPPHMVIGQKKIYYRRRSVEQWLAEQERAAGESPVAKLRGLLPTLDDETCHLAKELIDRAPALSPQQLASIRTVIAGGDRG